MKKIILSLVLALSLVTIHPSFISAQGSNPPPTGGSDIPPTEGSNVPPISGSNTKSVGINFKIENPFNDKVGNSLFGLMKAIVDNIILPVGAVLCVLAFIYAGFLFVMAGGDTTKIKTARTALLYAAIGTAILLGSWVLANAICHTINLLGGPVCPA